MNGAGSAAAPAGCSPRGLLALLVFYYAAGIYRSDEISKRLANNQCLFQVCLGQIPSAAELNSFRRTHERLIANCLTTALRYLVAQPGGIFEPLDEGFIAEDVKHRLLMASCLNEESTLQDLLGPTRRDCQPPSTKTNWA